jgi:hypothetical protein
MSEAIFFELKSKKIKSFIMNFILVYGLLFFELPGQENLHASLHKLDLILSVIFGVPLAFQFFGIFKPTFLKIDRAGLTENITLQQTKLRKEDITGYRFIKLLFTYYVIVDIKNPTKYIRSQKLWKKWISWYNYKQIKSPIKISVSRLDHSVEEIYESIKKVQKI